MTITNANFNFLLQSFFGEFFPNIIFKLLANCSEKRKIVLINIGKFSTNELFQSGYLKK